MRLTGTLKSWNDERGFGLIARTDGAPDLFLHISELPMDGTRPTVGERLTYEVGRGKNGKPQAINVIRQAFGDTRNMKRVPSARRAPASRTFPRAVVLMVLLALGVYGYKHYEQTASLLSKNAGAVPGTVEQLQAPAPVRESVSMSFTCDGRTHCSQMTSCTEAKFFLKNCPGTKMDGNNDGTPCEQQWCTSPFAK